MELWRANVTTTWTIAIDWDRNGSYTDPMADVTTRVISVRWFLGMRQPYQEVADNSRLELVLDNSDWRFSPEYAGSPLSGKVRPQRPVRITSTHEGVQRIHWVGWLSEIQPRVNRNGDRTIIFVACGPLQFYRASEVQIPLQENKRTDEIVGTLIEQVIMPPALSAAWVLGRVGHSELGATTFLADTRAAHALEEGTLTLGMAGDNWVRRGGPTDITQDSFDVYRAIRDVTVAERGRFFFDREGRAMFRNRHHLLYERPVKAVFANTMVDLEYTYAGVEHLKNEVFVVCHPRQISPSADQVLWELGESIIRVDKGKKRSVYLKFQDETGNRIGGRDLTIDDLTFEQGTAITTITEKATGVELLVDNTAGTSDAVISRCTIKGRKITDFDLMEAKATSNASIVNYGRRTLRLNLPSIDALDDAQLIADFELNRREEPRGIVRSIKVRSHGLQCGIHHRKQLALTIGDCVSLEESQVQHTGRYIIVGEAHSLTSGARLYETTWYLEPVPDVFPWQLGNENYSKLGTTTVLTY